MQSFVHMVIPVCKNAAACSSCIKAETPKWFGFSPSLSLELAINDEDNEATPWKRAKTSDPTTQVAIDTLQVSLLTMRMKMHGVLMFLTEFQAHAKISETYLASQQKVMEVMEMILEKL